MGALSVNEGSRSYEVCRYKNIGSGVEPFATELQP
jgi:hypothetical protein